MTDDYLPPVDRFAEVVARLAEHTGRKPKAVANSMYAIAIEEKDRARNAARDSSILADTARRALRDILFVAQSEPETDLTAKIRRIAREALGE